MKLEKANCEKGNNLTAFSGGGKKDYIQEMGKGEGEFKLRRVMLKLHDP